MNENDMYTYVCLKVPSFTPTGLIEDIVEGGFLFDEPWVWNRHNAIFNHPDWKYKHWTDKIEVRGTILISEDTAGFLLEEIENNDISALIQRKIDEFFMERPELFDQFGKYSPYNE